MNLHDTTRFYLNSSQIYPEIGSLQFSDAFDEDICAMRRTLETEFIFANTADPLSSTFSELLALEQEKDICHSIDLVIEKDCDVITYPNIFDGRVNLRDGSWSYTTCKFKTSIESKDGYSCITDNWKKNKNFLDIEDKVTLSTLQGIVECQTLIGTRNPPSGSGWTIIDSTVKNIFEDQQGAPNNLIFEDITINWCRECFDSADGVPTGDGWILEGSTYYRTLSTNCNSLTRSYFQESPPAQGRDYYVEEEITSCTYVDFESDNGITFHDFLEFYTSECCIISDFFNINPDGTAPNNLAYSYAAQWLHNMVIFLSSSVIRANATQNAFNAGTEEIDAGDKNFCDIWADLKKMFNLVMIYDPISGCIRIEHVSYKRNRPILNLKTYADGIYIKEGMDWTYNKLDFPRRESWLQAFDTGSRDFDGAFVDYDSNCTSDEEEECKLKCTVTDFAGIFNNANFEDDTSKLGTITIVSTTAGQINSSPGSFSGSPQLNGPLSLPNIIENLHIWDRPLSGGLMNDKIYSFLTCRKQRKSTVTIKMCCMNYYSGIYNSDMLVKTKFGIGEIRSATYYDPSEKLVLEIVS